jgi:hypothetical protein
MAIVAYIPESLQLDGRAVASPLVLTLYNPDGDAPTGSLTANDPIPAGQSGRLVSEGTRGGKLWSVTLPQVTVTHKSAVGCEFSIAGKPERVVLKELGEEKGPRAKGLEEKFDIR